MRPDLSPTRQLTDLIAAFNLRLIGDDVGFTGIAMASGDIQAGDLFAAVPGQLRHGATFTQDAISAGAVAVLTDELGAKIIWDAGLILPVVIAPGVREVLGEICAWFYGDPARALTVIGVTGTNGKTTTCYLTEAAFAAAGNLTGLLGTVEMRAGDRKIASERTSVESPVLHGALALMRDSGVSACVLEISSHALAYNRVGGLQVDVAGFTNLQRDHLDFHGSMAEYFDEKAKLFTPQRAKRGVICIDDQWGEQLVERATVPVETLATGGQAADWQVRNSRLGADGVGTDFELVTPSGEVLAAHSPLPGAVNVANAALAIALAFRGGVPLNQAVLGVAGATGIPGRMERVVERGGGLPLCIVDFAHTPDALELALRALRPATPGRLIVVFGAGGDRDPGKRPLMGASAARAADVVIVTDENSRSEPPEQIRSAIMAGAKQARPDTSEVYEVSPRPAAIRFALQIADEQDTIVVAGKGHEPTLEIAGVHHPFDDRDVVRKLVAQSDSANENLAT